MEEKKSLLTIAHEAQQIANILIERGGDLTEDLDQILTANTKELAIKVDSYKAIEDRLDAEEKFWSERAAQAKALATSAKTAKDNLKNRLLLAMQMLEVESISGESVEYKLAPSPEKLEFTERFKESELPGKYIIVTQTVDKAKIKADLQAGEQVPNAFLSRGRHIRSVMKRSK